MMHLWKKQTENLCMICAIVMFFLHSRYCFFSAFRKEFQKLGGAFTTLGKSFGSDERTGKKIGVLKRYMFKLFTVLLLFFGFGAAYFWKYNL